MLLLLLCYMAGSANHSAGKKESRTKKTLECRLPDTFYHDTLLFLQHYSILPHYQFTDAYRIVLFLTHVIGIFLSLVNHFYDMLQSADFTYFIVSLNTIHCVLGHIHPPSILQRLTPEPTLPTLCAFLFFTHQAQFFAVYNIFMGMWFSIGTLPYAEYCEDFFCKLLNILVNKTQFENAQSKGICTFQRQRKSAPLFCLSRMGKSGK